MNTRKPPIKCIPCRVTYDGPVYHILSNGEVRECVRVDTGAWQDFPQLEDESKAKLIRREASRLRRNRNARERNQALRSLRMTKTPYGWE